MNNTSVFATGLAAVAAGGALVSTSAHRGGAKIDQVGQVRPVAADAGLGIINVGSSGASSAKAVIDILSVEGTWNIDTEANPEVGIAATAANGGVTPDWVALQPTSTGGTYQGTSGLWPFDESAEASSWVTQYSVYTQDGITIPGQSTNGLSCDGMICTWDDGGLVRFNTSAVLWAASEYPLPHGCSTTFKVNFNVTESGTFSFSGAMDSLAGIGGHTDPGDAFSSMTVRLSVIYNDALDEIYNGTEYVDGNPDFGKTINEEHELVAGYEYVLEASIFYSGAVEVNQYNMSLDLDWGCPKPTGPGGPGPVGPAPIDYIQ